MENINNYTYDQIIPKFDKIFKNEFSNYVSEIGFYQVHEARSFLFFQDTELLEDNSYKAIILAGKAKLLHLEGNLIESHKMIKKAIRLARSLYAKDNNLYDTLAFVLLEKGILHRKLNEMDSAIETFSEALLFAKSVNLIKIINFRIELINADRYSNYDLSNIAMNLDALKINNLTTAYYLGIFRYCDLLIKQKDYKTALNHLFRIKTEVENLGYKYIHNLINITISYIYQIQQSYSKSIKLLEEVISTTESKYLLSFAYENIAACKYKQGEYQEAVDWCYKALDISINSNVISQVPGECLFLGRIYHDFFNKPIKAKYFYQIGAEHSIRYIQMGLSMSGHRKNAIEKYIKFLSEYFPEEIKDKHVEVDNPDSFFKQFEGKPWTEIKELFHFNLIIYHRLKSHKFENFLKGIGLIKATYYSHHLKLKGKGFEFPDLRLRVKEIPSKSYVQSIQDYIDMMDDKKWYPANKKFDEDIMTHLFKVYGFMKTKLAKGLSLSYQAVRNKTDGLSGFGG
jgi:tetratricopeptide (TPR) repeat protein